MIAYSIGVIHLIRELWYTHPHITQPWYMDEAGEGGKLERILEQFQDLQARGTPRGCSPEPTNSILIVALMNVARAEEFF